MEYLIHFVFELIKISILSSIYVSILLVVFRIIAKKNPGSFVDQLSKRKLLFWFVGGSIISTSMFIFMFTYYGNHGLGDFAIVPIGHHKAVSQIDSQFSYIENEKGTQIEIYDFVVKNDHLYAKKVYDFNGLIGDYVVWDLENDTWKLYENDVAYFKAMKKFYYPAPHTFRSFDEHYSEHWNGWRFFLLP